MNPNVNESPYVAMLPVYPRNSVVVHPNATAMFITPVPVTPTTSGRGDHVTVNLTCAPKKRASGEGSSAVEPGPSGLPPKKRAMARDWEELDVDESSSSSDTSSATTPGRSSLDSSLASVASPGARSGRSPGARPRGSPGARPRASPGGRSGRSPGGPPGSRRSPRISSPARDSPKSPPVYRQKQTAKWSGGGPSRGGRGGGNWGKQLGRADDAPHGSSSSPK